MGWKEVVEGEGWKEVVEGEGWNEGIKWKNNKVPLTLEVCGGRFRLKEGASQLIQR